MPKLKPILHRNNIQKTKIKDFFLRGASADNVGAHTDTNGEKELCEELAPHKLISSSQEPSCSSSSSSSTAALPQPTVTSGPSYCDVFSMGNSASSLSDLEKVLVLQGGGYGCHQRAVCHRGQKMEREMEGCAGFTCNPGHYPRPYSTQYYPCVYTALCTLITYPVSMCTAERSFSALKRIKTPLRNTMTEDRLSALALLHIHKNSPIEIDRLVT